MTVDDLAAETDFKFIARLQNAKSNAQDFERQQRAIAGLETGDGNSHQTLLLAAANASTVSKKKRKDKLYNDMHWFDLIQQQINDMQTLIDGAEGDFTSQYGEDWREQYAMRILDPDVMPQRHDGESLEKYRARVEQALIDELLSSDGTIKDGYKDHPEYGQLAQWAQWKHDQQLAMAINDPSMSEAEREAAANEFTHGAAHYRITQALDITDAGSVEGRTVDAAKDSLEDETLAAVPETTENNFVR